MLPQWWSTILLGSLLLVDGKTATRQQESKPSSTSTPTTPSLPRRERNLDFLDGDTLAYYLGLDASTAERLEEPPTPSESSHNVAVMFYAQWDRNSHSLAPAWDAIGTMLKAGTKKSNLILSLFDCELDNTHLRLCHAAGVTHYPTLLFISPSRTWPHKPHVQKSKKTLPHTTQFPGNWQYDKSVLDWLRTMQMMSGWTSFWIRGKGPRGWWQAASHDPETAELLPVGIPVTASSSSSSAEMRQQAADVQELKEEKKEYEELVLRSSILLDATLFPIADPTNPNSTDLYAFLATNAAWDAADVKSQVVRTCAMEVALDYCVRLTSHKTTELVSLKYNATDNNITELEKELKGMIALAEPYCDSIEACIVDGFTSPVCRPSQCPFQQEAPCRYLSSCFDDSIQQDYAKAMELDLSSTTTTASAAAAAQDTAVPKSKKRGWF